MGKSSKKANIEVAPAAVSSPVSKSAKKGKRDSEAAMEKSLSAKKQKKETMEVQVKQKDDKKSKKAPPPKKKPETSSSEDTSSDSEKEVQIAPKMVVQPVKQPTKQKDDKKSKKAPPPKKKLETSSSEDTSPDSEEEEMKPLSGDSSTKVPAAGVKNGTALTSKKKDDSSDEDSDSSESDSDEDKGNVKKTGVVSKVVSSQKNGVQDSSSGTSESETDDEEVTAKQALMVQKPPTKVKAGASNKKGESSEGSERELDDKNPQYKPKVEESSEDSSDESSSEGEEEPQRKKLKVPEATGLNASKPDVKAAKKESSSDEDEDDSSEESSDVEPPKVPEATGLNASKPDVKAAKKESSSDEDEDDSSDEEPPKVQQTKPTKPSTKSSSSSEESAEDSSEESEDEQPKKKTLAKKGIDSKDAPSANGTSNQSAKKFHKKEEKTPAGNQSVSSGVKVLFVGNLSYNVGEDDVVAFFKEAGEVIDVRLPKFDDGNFKGFGHVEFATVEEAQRALNKLNGQELLGRVVKLDFARERGAYTPPNGKENRSFQKAGKGQSHTIFVRGLDKSLEMDQIQSSLEEHFGSCGEITRVFLPKDYETGVSKGIGYLDFGDGNAFSKALELNGSDLGGYTLTVMEAKPRSDNRDGGWSGGRGSGRDGGWGGGRGGRDGGRGGARGRGGGRGGRGRGGRDGAHKQSAGTPSQGKKITFGDD